LSRLRVELLNDDPCTARRRVCLYLDVLGGRLTGRDLWQREQLENRLGVTRGSLKPTAASGARSRPATG
jgi:U32 family peptidase